MYEKTMPPMEELMLTDSIWKIDLVNRGPIVFTGDMFFSHMKSILNLDAQYDYSFGDFVANETTIMSLTGSSGNILRFRDEMLPWFSHITHFSTVLYRLKDLAKRYNPNTKLVVRSIPEFSIMSDFYFEAVEDSGCMFWPSSLTDGIVNIDMWKNMGGLKSTIENLRKSCLPNIKILMECNNLSDSILAIKEGADGVMLSNLRSELVTEIAKAVRERFKKAYIEYSGDITLTNIEGYASSGVDTISVFDITRMFGSTRIDSRISEIEITEEKSADNDERA